MLFLVEKYLEAHPGEGPEVEAERVATWAYGRGMWKPSPQAPVDILKRRISRALRDDYVTDPAGREIRKHHPVVRDVVTPQGTKQQSTWYPIYQTHGDVIRQSFQLRRRRALADVSQLSLDFESWNDFNDFGEKLDPLDFNFNTDLEEMKLPVEYPEGLDEGEFDEDEEDEVSEGEDEES